MSLRALRASHAVSLEHDFTSCGPDYLLAATPRPFTLLSFKDLYSALHGIISLNCGTFICAQLRIKKEPPLHQMKCNIWWDVQQWLPSDMINDIHILHISLSGIILQLSIIIIIIIKMNTQMTEDALISSGKHNQCSTCFIISQQLHSNKHSRRMTVLTSAKIICSWLHNYNHRGELIVLSFTREKKKSSSQVDIELPK